MYMLESGFFNSLHGDRKYNAANFAEYFSNFISNGVFARDDTANLQVSADKNMTLAVGSGSVFIDGYWGKSSLGETVVIPTANGVYGRYDRVICRLNFSDRVIELLVISGTPSINPVAPTLTRDGTFYDLSLATVYVGQGVTNITDANIHDDRTDSNLCGFVNSLIDNISTDWLFRQYEATWLAFLESLGSDERVGIITLDNTARGSAIRANILTPFSANYTII